MISNWSTYCIVPRICFAVGNRRHGGILSKLLLLLDLAGSDEASTTMPVHLPHDMQAYTQDVQSDMIGVIGYVLWPSFDRRLLQDR